MKIIKYILWAFGMAILFNLLSFNVTYSDRYYSPTTSKNKLKGLYIHVLTKAPLIYSGCRFSYSFKPYLSTCGYQSPRGYKNPSIQWEHVVNAYRLGQGTSCWSKGGRRSCIRQGGHIRECLVDMHNLYPALSSINSFRSNKSFGISFDSHYPFGKRVGLKASKLDNVIEPPDRAKGKVARSYLFMDYRECIELNNLERTVYEQWSSLYPPAEEELVRNYYIYTVQGTSNPFILDY